MTSFKLRISGILITENPQTVRVGLFVAPSPNHTYQRCGELTLTPAEAAILKEKIEND